MSDDEQFQSGDSGATDTIPTPCGDLRKGGYVMLKGYPCKVTSRALFFLTYECRS